MGETFDEAFGDAYQTFTVKARDGRDVELAVMEEFEFDGRLYVAAEYSGAFSITSPAIGNHYSG